MTTFNAQTSMPVKHSTGYYGNMVYCFGTEFGTRQETASLQVYGGVVRNSIHLEYEAVSLRTRFAFHSVSITFIGQRGARVPINVTLYRLKSLCLTQRRRDGRLK
jgi:hypothetical protein